MNRILKAAAVAATMCLALVGCSKENGEVHVTSVTVSPASLSLVEGDSGKLAAEVLPADAADKSVTWKSSDDAVASVDQSGTVTAVKEGDATITVTSRDGGKTATAKVTVSAKAIAVTRITLSKSALALEAGQEETLMATIEPENATNVKVTWTSSDETVATVDENGKVTAVADGSAIITVTTEDGGKTATCEVTVAPIVHVTSVWINADRTDLTVGDEIAVSLAVYPDDATNKTVIWSSSDPEVATVDENGKVTVVKNGIVVITATSEDNSSCKSSVTFTVFPKGAVRGVSIDRFSQTVEIGESCQLVATISPDDAYDKSVTWSSSDPEVATIDADGNVKGIAGGTATITVTTVDGGFTAECRITVNDGDISSEFDADFLQWLRYDPLVPDSGDVKRGDVAQVKELDLNGVFDSEAERMTSLKGVEYLSNLEKLEIICCTSISSVDLSKNTELTWLNSWYCDKLSSVDVSKCTKLGQLAIPYSQVSSLDISNCAELWSLTTYGCPITTIDVSKNARLRYLYMNDCQLAAIDLSKNTALASLYVDGNNLVSLDISSCTNLKNFDCENNPGDADGKFMVTVWKGFTTEGTGFPAAGTTWKKDSKTVTLEYKEVE